MVAGSREYVLPWDLRPPSNVGNGGACRGGVREWLGGVDRWDGGKCDVHDRVGGGEARPHLPLRGCLVLGGGHGSALRLVFFQVWSGVISQREGRVVEVGDVNVRVLTYEAVGVTWPCPPAVMSHTKFVLGQWFKTQRT